MKIQKSVLLEPLKVRAKVMAQTSPVEAEGRSVRFVGDDGRLRLMECVALRVVCEPAEATAYFAGNQPCAG